jgi:thymidylate synthase (FAD)
VDRVVLGNKHLAVLRHGFASVKITGISRLTGRQILRKAHADYLERSQRYVGVSDCSCSIPYNIKNDPILKEEYLKKLDDDIKFYERLRAAGMTKEDSRYALPQCIDT